MKQDIYKTSIPVLLGLASEYSSSDQAPKYYATKVAVLSMLMLYIRDLRLQMLHGNVMTLTSSSLTGWRTCMAAGHIAATRVPASDMLGLRLSSIISHPGRAPECFQEVL